jgi:hypothetical protein
MRIFRSVLTVSFLSFLSVSTIAASVVINEIMKDPIRVPDSAGEWFELHNTAEDSLNLDGWTIRDSGRDVHKIAREDGLIFPPGHYIVLGREEDPAMNGGYTPDYIYDGFTLSNGEDEIVLVDPSGTVVDSVAYGGDGWPNGAGQSLEFIEESPDNAVGENWVLATEPYGDGDLGTPGKPNGASPVGIGDDGREGGRDAPLVLRSFPNPFRGSTTIAMEIAPAEREAYRSRTAGEGRPMTLRIYDVRGRLVRNLWTGRIEDRPLISWDGTDDRGYPLPPGSYILQLTGSGKPRQSKLMKEGR